MDFSFDLSNERDVQALLEIDECIDYKDDDFVDILKALQDSSTHNAERVFLSSNYCNLSHQDIPSTYCHVNMQSCEINQSTQNSMCQNILKSSVCKVHAYQDFLNVPEHALPRIIHKNMRGRKQETFPTKLFKVLEYSDAGGYSSIISWLPHARAFKIYDHHLFQEEVMKKFFFQTRLQSFKHQLYMYGFQKVGCGNSDAQVYFHELFLRGRFDLCKHIHRLDKNSRAIMSASRLVGKAPDFYKLPSLVESKSVSKKSALATTKDNILPVGNVAIKPKYVRYELL